VFWNGTNWVDERPQDVRKQTTPRRWRRRTLYATIASFLVVAALLIPEWTVQAAGPSLSVDGSSVAGGSMQVSGRSFSANAWVRLRWDSRTGGMAYPRASSRGTFRVAMGVPSDALPGSHVITASVYSYTARYRSYRSVDVADIRVYVVRPTPAPTAPGAASANPTSAPTQVPARAGATSGATSNPTTGAVPTSTPAATPSQVATTAPTPKPTPQPTPKPTPVPTAVPTPVPTKAPTPTPVIAPSGTQVPDSIDSTGATDVSAALNTWLASVPDGSTVVFKAGGTYKMKVALQLASRHNLVLEGNGATLKSAGGYDQLSSLIVLGHKYGGSWTGTCSGIVIRDFNLVGTSPSPGKFISGKEGQHGVEIEDSSNIEISHITVSAVYGDAIKVGGSSNGVRFHDSHVYSVGRNSVTVTMGQNVTAEKNVFDHSGYCVWDIESNYSSEHSSNFIFRNNTAGTWGNAFGAAVGIAGSQVSGVTVTGNKVTGGTLLTVINLARRQNVTFTNNTSTVSARGPVLQLAHIDGLTVTGNTQPLSSGSLASITDCTSVTYP
jgi:hypothetical protein